MTAYPYTTRAASGEIFWAGWHEPFWTSLQAPKTRARTLGSIIAQIRTD
jgi:hypothetical protein